MAKLIDEKFEDINGRKYRLYTVRSMGPGRGFNILDKYRNMFLYSEGWATRQQAWDFLKTLETER